MQAEQEKQSVHTLQEDKMPQVQYVNNPGIGSALGQFGSGFLEEYTKGRQRLQEEDALQQLIQGVNPEMPEEDMLAQILSSKGVPFEKKKNLADIFSGVKKRQNESQLNQQKIEFEREKNLSKLATDLNKEDKALQKEQKKTAEDIKSFQGALSIVEEMKNIRKKGNLGFNIVGPASTRAKIFRGETAKDVGRYETLGKSLISYATSIPIRNRIEFEVLAEKLYDPNISDEEAYGILDGMKQIISNSLNSIQGEQTLTQEQPKKERPPLTSFVRKP